MQPITAQQLLAGVDAHSDSQASEVRARYGFASTGRDLEQAGIVQADAGAASAFVRHFGLRREGGCRSSCRAQSFRFPRHAARHSRLRAVRLPWSAMNNDSVIEALCAALACSREDLSLKLHLGKLLTSSVTWRYPSPKALPNSGRVGVSSEQIVDSRASRSFNQQAQIRRW